MTTPEMIEISSSEDEEEVEVEEPEDEPPSPTARGTRTEQTSGETDTGVDDIEVDDDAEDMGGQPSEAKKRRTEVRSLRDQFEKVVADASNARYCLVCGGDHNLDECQAQDNEAVIDAIMRMRLMMEQQSKSPSSSERSRTATRGRKDKLPKKGIMPEGKRWRRTRIHGEGGSDQELLQPTCLHVRDWRSRRRWIFPRERSRSSSSRPRREESSRV